MLFTQFLFDWALRFRTAALPASVTRLGLSRVINHLLALEEHQPFDFLIHSELLRDTLGEFLEKREISAEVGAVPWLRRVEH